MDGRAQNVSAVLRLLFGFVVLSTVAGLLMAGLAIPAVGATGQVAKGGVDFFNDLPSEFTVSPLAQQSRILDADGKLIANPYDENRIIVPLAKISKNMQNAQIAIEDARFYEHGGLDVRGFSRAMISNLQGGDVQGASTLTQQYVKITLQENALRRGDKEAAAAAVDKTYSRKLQELKYALNVEENFTKEQILEGYLNLVYYGDQAYGVEAAALNYFGVTAAKLTLGQAALLAGTVQQPTAYNPVINPAAAQDRRNLVLDRMQALGMASAKDVAAAKKVDIKTMIKRKPAKGVCHRSSQPYFCAYVMEWLQKSPQMAVLGKTPAERLKAINQGGLTIRTTLKGAMQKSAQKELTKAVPINNKQNLAGAVTIIEPGTGKVLAMAQATDFSKSQTNLNVDTKYGGGPTATRSGRPRRRSPSSRPWSAACRSSRRSRSRATSPERPAVFQASQMNDKCGTVEPWKVRNDIPISGGPMTLREGVTKSVNPFFATLNVKLGACSVRDTMLKMGLHRADGKAISSTIAGHRPRRRRVDADERRQRLRDPGRERQVLRAQPCHVDHDARQEGHRDPRRPVQAGHLGGRRRGRQRPSPERRSERHRVAAVGQRRPSGRRQDRDDREAQPDLVLRVHPPARDRGVGRQRQAGEQERQALHPRGQVLR